MKQTGEQTEAKARRFHAGLVAALAVFAALGSCDGGWSGQEPPPPQEAEIGYKDGDVVGVRVSVPRQSGARSLNPETLEFFADSYEAVFRKIHADNLDEDTGNDDLGKDLYYRGEGDGEKGYISVAVPVGGPYEVLLIAGIGRTLVGAGYLGKHNSPDDIAAGKGPVAILPGKVNEVVITLEKLAPQWNTMAPWFADPDNPNDFNVGEGMIPASPDPLAEGGDVTDVTYWPGEAPAVYYEIHTFTAPDNAPLGGQTERTLTFKNGEHPETAEVLVVAGGGGGGLDGGGGGAGRYIYVQNYPIGEGSLTIPVKVGAGGDKPATFGSGVKGATRGGAGGDSQFGDDIIAKGGGGGASHTSTTANSGNAGGSGGGGTYVNKGGDALTGTVPDGIAADNLGNAGGGGPGGGVNIAYDGRNGGGGGAGGPGGSPTTAGTGALGGVGVQCGISGTAQWYAGGGAGAAAVSVPSDANPPAEAYGATGGQDGKPGTGDGGSGGGNGGSGIVIVRFKRVAATRYSHVPLVTNPDKKLDVFFNLGKFEPLMLADVKTPAFTNTAGGTLNLTLAADPAVRLWPRYITDSFPLVAFSQNTADDPSNLYIGKPKPEDGHTYTITVASDPLKTKYAMLRFTNGAALPQRDVDGLLEFELKYQAFGVSDHGGKIWTIKNGLYNTPDDAPELGGDGVPTGRGAGAGSYIPVKFGAGTPAEKKGEGTVIYTK